MGCEEPTFQNQDKKYKIITLGLAVHVLLLFAVLEIYFSTPLESGMKLIRSTNDAPAKRLVIFLCDGLRAESILDNVNRTPFLKSIIESRASWGVAHTRAPTESRPCHVALLAGFYEDPSAIMTGWKRNPVYFDSVINQCSNVWYWGNPDTMNMFFKKIPPHVHEDTYGAATSTDAKEHIEVLDTWVFKKIEHFLSEKVNKCNGTDCDKLKGSGNVFFLHLFDIDNSALIFKPNSKEFINNIHIIDRDVKKISEMFDAAFKDNQTVFVFTADHGMTDGGSHGGGSPHETETPFIAWGAGIKRDPNKKDVQQVDVAPLLASLIGINFPRNSLGIIPLDYLNTTEENLAQIQMSNTLQLLQLFNIKRLQVENNALVFLPYMGVTSEVLNEKLAFLRTLQKENMFRTLRNECFYLTKFLVNAIDYYHNYYKYPLLISVSSGFIGWILFMLQFVLDNKELTNKYLRPKRKIVGILNMVPILVCYAQKYPFSYYVYFSFPFVVFTMLVDLRKLSSIARKFGSYVVNSKGKFFNVLVYLFGIELMVYGFFDRAAFSVLSILIGLWVLPSDSFGESVNKRHKIFWLSLCVILSIFPLLPVEKTYLNLPLYILGCVIWIVLFYEIYRRLQFQHGFQNSTQHEICYVQIFYLVSASIYRIFLEMAFIGDKSAVKYFSWLLLILPPSLIFFTNTCIPVRLIAIFFGFAPFYLLVCFNFDTLFLAVLVPALCSWLLIESKYLGVSDSPNLVYYGNFESYTCKDGITFDTFRRAFLFMVFSFLGFFGTADIESINSFDRVWVKGFLTTHNLFKMAGLISLKVIIPLLFTCCILKAINLIGKENILKMFCIVLLFSDLMVLQLLYLIENVGSWLDMSSSLIRFVIMEGFAVILLILYGVAHLFITTSCVKRK